MTGVAIDILIFHLHDIKWKKNWINMLGFTMAHNYKKWNYIFFQDFVIKKPDVIVKFGEKTCLFSPQNLGKTWKKQ